MQDTHGISVSPANLSTFRSRYLENQALKDACLQSAIFNATLKDLHQQKIDPGDAQVEAAVRRLFLFKVVNQGDIGTLDSSPTAQPSLPSNSLKYPKTPSIWSAAIFLPERSAPWVE